MSDWKRVSRCGTGGGGLAALAPASDASLGADPAYVRLLEAESTWPNKYRFAQPNPSDPRRFPMWGLPAQGTPTCCIADFNRLLPANFRVATRASQNRLQTPLYGRAPYRLVGRGDLLFTDVSTQLQQGLYDPNRGSRVGVEEASLDRFDFVDVPRDLRDLPWDTRKGSSTRRSPEYMLQPRQ